MPTLRHGRFEQIADDELIGRGFGLVSSTIRPLR
jgi:hypothetical protein